MILFIFIFGSGFYSVTVQYSVPADGSFLFKINGLFSWKVLAFLSFLPTIAFIVMYSGSEVISGGHRQTGDLIFQILTAASMKLRIFWDVLPCS
jgi:hypothetical protein